ncbi:MAG: hypothetical protein OEU76_06890, partial [Cyclobacteriaceae bacterium]|nr:hypothetical protein [Cyclobacteriaceae bacterium]
MDSQRATISIEDREYTETEFLKQLFQAAQEYGYGFALWRLPNQPTTQVVLSHSLESFSLDTPFEELPSGFLFHPFDLKKQGVFIKADLMFRFTEGALIAEDSQLSSNSLTWFKENVQKKKFPETTVTPKHITLPQTK